MHRVTKRVVRDIFNLGIGVLCQDELDSAFNLSISNNCRNCQHDVVTRSEDITRYPPFIMFEVNEIALIEAEEPGALDPESLRMISEEESLEYGRFDKPLI
jgi:hypothetical protein